MSEFALKLENLSKNYTLGKREVKCLTNLNLEIKKGEFTAIMGPSGSGKTTLLNVIGCIDKPTSGKVLVDNVDIGNLPESELYKIRRDKIGFIFQNFNLLPYLNARENVELAMEFAGKYKDQRSKRANELLATVGLAGREQHRPNKLKPRRTATRRHRPRLSQRPRHHLSRRTHRQLGHEKQTGNRQATRKPKHQTRHHNHHGYT